MRLLLCLQLKGLSMNDCILKINAFYENTWPEFRKKVEETDIPLFKDYEPLKLK